MTGPGGDATSAGGDALRPPVPGGGDPRMLRCADADRERVAEALRVSAGDGRLTLSELEERLEAAFRARTYGDLENLTADLPPGPYPVPGLSARTPLPYSPGRAPGPVVRAERISAVLGEEKRTGRWEVPARLDVVCVLGNVRLDFTEAIVRSPEVVVAATVWLGEVVLVVPDGIDVRIEGGASVLGERRSTLRGPVTRGGPVYRVGGTVVLGGITVKPPRRPLFGRR
jgi:hypothetical protein